MPLQKAIEMDEENEGVEMTEAYLGFPGDDGDDDDPSPTDGGGPQPEGKDRKDRQKPQFRENEDDEEVSPSKVRGSMTAPTPRAKSAAVDAETVGVPLNDVLRHLRYRTHSSQLLFDFILYVPFLVLFIFFFWNGRDVTANYYVVRALKDQLLANELPTEEVEKHFVDIANPYDWGRWVSYVLVPNLWTCKYEREAHAQLTAQGQNYLLGALRVRTLRVRAEECTANPHIYGGADCRGTWAGGDEEKFDRFSYPNPVDYPEHTLVHSNADLSYVVDWPAHGARVGLINFTTNAGADFADHDGVYLVKRAGRDGSHVEYPTASGAGMEEEEFQRVEFDALYAVFPAEQTAVDGYTFVTNASSNVRDPARWTVAYTNDNVTRATNLSDPSSVAWTVFATHEHAAADLDTVGYAVAQSLPSPTAFRALRFAVQLTQASAMRDEPETPFLYKHRACSGSSGYIIGDISVYHCGGYTVDLPFNSSCRAVTDATKALQADNAPFIDTLATRFAVAEFFVYSVQTDTYTSVKLFTEFAPGGALVNKWQLRTFAVYTGEPPILDCFFLAFVLYFCWSFVNDWRAFNKGYPPGSRASRGQWWLYLFEFWNVLELTNLVTFLVVFALQFAWMAACSQESFLFPFQPRYPEEFDHLLNLYMMKVYANSVNTVITFLKFLKYVRLNSRLNVLSATVSLKAPDMFACLIIFVFVVFAYALAATALFGSSISDYRNLFTAYSTLNRMLLGDFDYAALRLENRFLAGLYFWSFVVIGLFLLLNFLVAIMSEGFAEVSGQNADVPLDEQLTKAYTDLKRALRPTRLLQGVKMWLRGNSRHSLLLRATIKMEDYRSILEEAGDAADDQQALIYKRELPVFIGREEYALLGGDFMDDVWEDVVYDFRQAEKTNASVLRMENQLVVQLAVRTATEREAARHRQRVAQDAAAAGGAEQPFVRRPEYPARVVNGPTWR
ncbi:Polycystin-2 [Diplonema papillatum]|nr:Polycystin-2 [Diplonema papillatum]